MPKQLNKYSSTWQSEGAKDWDCTIPGIFHHVSRSECSFAQAGLTARPTCSRLIPQFMMAKDVKRLYRNLFREISSEFPSFSSRFAENQKYKIHTTRTTFEEAHASNSDFIWMKRALWAYFLIGFSDREPVSFCTARDSCVVGPRSSTVEELPAHSKARLLMRGTVQT